VSRRRPAVVLQVVLSWAATAIFLPVAAGRIASAALPQQHATDQAVVRILGDRALWSDDFYGLLTVLPDFRKAGERWIEVFADRVMGANRYQRLKEAQRRTRTLEKHLNRGANQRLAAAVFDLFHEKRSIVLKPAAILLLDDRTYRVVALASEARFLPPSLKISTVLERIGEPEKVTTELLDDGTERRPRVLVIRHYAGGAIAFVESDIALQPGLVSQVFLDVPSVVSALLKQAP
jgi:hypothetical protein